MKRKHKVLLKIFGISVGLTLGLCLILGTAGMLTYNNLILQPSGVATGTGSGSGEEGEVDNEHIINVLDNRINKTVAIFGVDATERLTDVILVANFNSETNKIKVISIPRDTKVKWTDNQRAVAGRQTSWVETSKINEMTSLGGPENIRALTIDQIERILGMRIDNYVVINLDTFKKIVDAVDGVEVNVPQRMYWIDRSGGLYIDLQPGLQVLDGEKAEQFVRFRRYPSGDLGRIEAQQLFLEAFAKKLMSPQIITKIPAIVTTLFNSVKTDIKLTELPGYYPYIEQLRMENVSFHSIPGEGRYENGISYFFMDANGTMDLMDELFYGEME